jgi:molybdate transport system substrate-binding protein
VPVRPPSRFPRPPVPVLVVLAVLAVLSGCGRDADTAAQPGGNSSVAPGPSGPLTVSAAASLTVPFTTIGRQFEAAHPGVDVTFTFDSSGTLATQINEGAPVDVFASADAASMAKVADGGLVAGTPVPFARNRLAIVVKKGNPREVKGLRDLATVGTVSLCGVEAPCGRYADQILRRAGVEVPADHVTRGQNAKAALTAVSAGDADAGIIYVTDITGDGVEAVALPDEQNARADYPAAVVRTTAHPALAQAFLADLTGPDGQAVLRSAGFLPPA